MAVGGDHHPPAVGQVIGFPDLAALGVGQLRERRLGQTGVQKALDIGVCHEIDLVAVLVEGGPSIEYARLKNSPIKKGFSDRRIMENGRDLGP